MNFTSLKGGVLSNLYCAQRIWTIPRRRRATWIRTTLRVHVAGVLSCIMFFLQMVFYKTQDCQENRGTLPRWKQATASICIRTIAVFAVCEGFALTFCEKSYHWGGYISISKDPPEMPTLPKNRLWKKKRDVFDKQQTWGLDLWISPFTACLNHRVSVPRTRNGHLVQSRRNSWSRQSYPWCFDVRNYKALKKPCDSSLIRFLGA